MAQLESELQRLAPTWKANSVDGVEDLLRWLGPLSRDDIDARSEDVSVNAVAQLVEERRVIEVVVAGERRFASAEDAARLRDALGVSLPPGLPAAFIEPVSDPLGDLLHRYARTHGPFLTSEVAHSLGLDNDRAAAGLAELERRGRLVRGEFRPEGVEREWCHNDVLRVLRRRSLAALRAEVEPVEQDVLARFQADWQLVGSNRRGVDGLADVIGLLQGASLPASALERDILPARMANYAPADLDTLLTAGELIWIGAGAVGTGDGRIRLLWRDQAHVFLPQTVAGPQGAVHDAIRSCLTQRGAVFWADLVAAASDAGEPYDDITVLTALWDLVWAGEVTNDALTPLRAVVSGAVPTASGRAMRSSRRPALRSLSRVGPPAGRSLVARRHSWSRSRRRPNVRQRQRCNSSSATAS
ncbi:MAG: crosslink repair DNA glycosylase YcaQ family protein [Acidimicrobiales bacterium]